MASSAARRAPVKAGGSLRKANSRIPAFETESILVSAGLRRKIVELGANETVFTQGHPAQNVMFIQKGSVRLTVVNDTGREAVVAVLGPGNFLGEACLAGHPNRMETAITMAPTSVMVIAKHEMIRALHREDEFSDRFIAYVLARNIQVEADLIDQLFNASEKRLARTLLLLARQGAPGRAGDVLPKVSQGMLAEMVGTTRSRVNFFMNKFRKLGLIQYDHHGGIHVDDSLLRVVLQR